MSSTPRKSGGSRSSQTPPPVSTQLVRDTAAVIAERVRGQFQALDGELGQVRSIISSATSNLSGSFTGLESESADQEQILRALVDELVAAVSGPEHELQTSGIQRLARETEDIVRHFVLMFRAMHEASDQMQTKFRRIIDRFQSALSQLEQIDRQALEADLLSLNSALEATEAGRAGRSFASIAQDVARLSHRTSDFASRVREQIQQMEDAIVMVTAAVDSIPRPDLEAAEGSRSAMAAIWKQMRELNDRVVAKAELIAVVSQRIREHVYTGVVSLQFEDIASQLIEHVRRRNSVMEEAFSRFADAMEHCADTTAMEAALRTLDHDLNTRCEGLAHKSVQQTTVDTGSIDLF